MTGGWNKAEVHSRGKKAYVNVLGHYGDTNTLILNYSTLTVYFKFIPIFVEQNIFV